MAEARRGLGRGLSALLDEAGSAAAAGAQANPANRAEAPIELIRRNPDQPRREFPEGEIDELAASIREKGVLQPILVRPAPGGGAGELEIIAGERRWRAAQRAGLRQIPVVVRADDDLAAIEIAIIENIQRADLNPIDEAESYRALIHRFGQSQEAIAQTVGKSRPYVANALRLLGLPQSVQAHLRAGRLSAGHARALAAAPDPATLAHQVIDRGLNVRQAEALARQAQQASGPARPGRKAVRNDADTRALEDDLAAVLGLKVEVIDRGGSGELRLQYASLEQLDALCRRLSQGPL